MVVQVDYLASTGSNTSSVDGSSEGGRISTSQLTSTLSLYSAALYQELQRHGYGGQLKVAPVLHGGQWVIGVTYQGEAPKGVPRLWQGHRVVVKDRELT